MKKVCKGCGRMFETETANEVYCSSLCRTTGKFMGGGGDTKKPIPPEMRSLYKKKAREAGVGGKALGKRKIRNGEEKYPRVVEMFNLPQDQRWALAKTFSEEEHEYMVRKAKKLILEEKKLDAMCSWEEPEDMSRGAYEGITGGSIGESDDGSI